MSAFMCAKCAKGKHKKCCRCGCDCPTCYPPHRPYAEGRIGHAWRDALAKVRRGSRRS